MALDKLTGENSMVFIRSEQLFDWSRRHSLWYMAFGIACCAIEGLMHASGPRFDFDRHGVFFRASPRQADVMIVAGTVNHKMAETVKRLYDQMPEPKWVVAMGACASTGGPFREYPNVVLGVDKVVPVDVYIPGCPPRPESVQYGFLQLMEKISAQTESGLQPDATHIAKLLSAAGVEATAEELVPAGMFWRVGPQGLRAALTALKDSEHDFAFMVDLFGIDTGEAVDVVYHLRSFTREEEVTVKVAHQYGSVLESIWDIYPAALMPERECAEMFGLKLSGHPNPKHLLLTDGIGPLLLKSVEIRGAEEVRNR